MSTHDIIERLAHEHGVDADTIVRAAIVDFADGKSHEAQAQVLRTVARLDARRGDKKRHRPDLGTTKIVTRTNPG